METKQLLVDTMDLISWYKGSRLQATQSFSKALSAYRDGNMALATQLAYEARNSLVKVA